MKNSEAESTATEKSKQKKTALDNFQLFYEEVPLELENRAIKPDKRSKDRLARRSRSRY